MSPSRHMRPIAAAGALVLAALTGGIPAMADTDPQDGSTSATTDEPTTQESTDTAPPAEGDNQDPDAPAEGEEGSAGEEGTAEAGEVSEGAGEPTVEEQAQEEEPALTSMAAEDEVGVMSVVGDVATIDIGLITDFHGQLAATDDTGGAKGVSGVFEGLEAANPGDTILVANGDSVGGSAFASAILNDEPTIDLLNLYGLEASTAGNHEFDQGWADFRDRIIAQASFPYLGANLSGPDTAAHLDPYVIVTTASGVDVAFVGTLTPELPSLVNPDGISGITVSDIYAATNAAAATLSDGVDANDEADVVIALTHYGHQGLTAGSFSADVDAVFTGHTHDPYEGTVAVQGGGEIPVIQGQYAGGTVAHLEFSYDLTTGEITEWTADNLPTVGAVGAADPDVVALVDDALALAAEAGEDPVGTITDDLLRPAGGSRGDESTIANFLGNVALWQGQQVNPGADIGVINPGGIRADFLYGEDGVITYAEAFTVQPFGNTMAMVDLTGAQVIEMLEQQWQPAGSSRTFLRLGISDNVTYVFDPDAAPGSRVIEVQIDGSPIDPAATYTVSANNFLLAGGDNFFVFDEGTNYVDTGIIDVDALINYFEAQSGPVSPDYTQYSVGVDLPLVIGGDLTVSSLAFTNDEPKPATATLWIDGVEIGTEDVDTTVMPPVDVTGQATFMIPETVALGEVTVRVETDDSVTDVTFDATSLEATTVNILNITDYHGRLEANGDEAGAAVLACAIKDWENPVFTSSGDNIGASTFVSASQLDQPTIDVLNAMGLAVSAVGNHELDRGWDWLYDNVLTDGTDYREAEFPYLAANLYMGDDPLLPQEYEIVEIDGVKVGFVGAVTEELPSLVSPAGIEGITVGPIAEAVNRVAGQLTDGDAANGEADVVIALIHEGLTSTGEDALTTGVFGELVSELSDDVTAVFGGHTHVAYAGTADSGLAVVQSASYGEALGRIELSVAPGGYAVVTDVEVIDLVVDGEAYCEGDPDIQAIVDDAVEQAEIVGSVPVGYIGADFNRAQQSDGSENRGGESTIGNLIADAQLWGTRELNTELAFMNPGGIRTDLEYEGTAEPVTNEDGVVTFQEAAEVQPFANTLVTMDLTGAQVLEVLEQQWQPADASRPFLKLGVAGLTYEYDPTAPAGERITKVMLDSGEEFDEAAMYRIVVNSFLASGGDNFTAFTGGANTADSGRIDLDVFVSYIGEFGTEASPLMPDYDQRAIGVVDVNGNGDAIETGQEIAIDLSSLLFSTNEPKAENVVVTFDGAVLGSFPIDPSIVDKTDEVGRAQVRVTIPDLDGYDKGEMVTLAVHLDTADGDTVLEWTYEMEGSEDGGTTPPLPDTGAEVADLGLMASALLFMGVAGLIARRRMTALQ